MSKNLEEAFKQRINLGNGMKTIEYNCPCCGVTFKSQRRDLTYVIITFMLALREMGEDYYHDYRSTIKHAIDKHNCTPTDYSLLLRSGWKLIETKPGRGNLKYKRLTQAGKDFLDDKLRVPMFHYQVPFSKRIFIIKKQTTSFTNLKTQYFDKGDNTPFLDQSQNNI